LKETRSGFEFGAGLFAGVEYFIAPGISIGGEVGWRATCETITRGREKRERWHNGSRETETLKGDFAYRGSLLGHTHGGITLTFYF
jgi:hypothetical protein